MKSNPYEKCPVIENEVFLLRSVCIDDANELFECYSDNKSALLFNSDNCTSDFRYKSIEEMKGCIESWLYEYSLGHFVRFSIIDKATTKCIGTIEFFSKDEINNEYGRVGLLRLDLKSEYENQVNISSMLDIINDYFYDLFEVDSIMTKCIDEGIERLRVLTDDGYKKLDENVLTTYSDYYISQLRSK